MGIIINYTYYFEHEWHDNGSRESGNKQYFFKNNELYFYLEDYSYGYNPVHEQFRVYIDKGKEVISSIKYLDVYYSTPPEGLENFEKLANVRCADDKKPKIADIMSGYNREYQLVKNSLK